MLYLLDIEADKPVVRGESRSFRDILKVALLALILRRELL